MTQLKICLNSLVEDWLFQKINVLFDKLIGLGEIGLAEMRNFRSSVVKKRDHFHFREYRRGAKINRTTLIAGREQTYDTN